MNKLPLETRSLILKMLCEGQSMRATARLADVSYNTVAKLLVDAGKVCADLHDELVQDVTASRIQCDEVWSFTYAKQKKRREGEGGARRGRRHLDLDRAGQRLQADRLMAGGRARRRVCNCLHGRTCASGWRTASNWTTDGHRAYLAAVEGAFGGDEDYAQLIKLYGEPTGQKGYERKYSPSECTGTRKRRVEGSPDPAYVSTSHVERQNLTMRMQMRRFTRLTNAFSKKFDNHMHMVALYTVWYNFIRIHKNASRHPGHGSGLKRDGMGHGRLGADHGRARAEAGSAQDLQQDFKMMHYQGPAKLYVFRIL